MAMPITKQPIRFAARVPGGMAGKYRFKNMARYQRKRQPSAPPTATAMKERHMDLARAPGKPKVKWHAQAQKHRTPRDGLRPGADDSPERIGGRQDPDNGQCDRTPASRA